MTDRQYLTALTTFFFPYALLEVRRFSSDHERFHATSLIGPE
jgi:hypothetical protein